MREVATWVWRTTDVVADAAFARARNVRHAFVSVPVAGPDATTSRLVRALRSGGTVVACLGSGVEWVDDATLAVTWLGRATASGLFDAVHLDVEPWARHDEWARRADGMLAGLARAVRAVRAATSLPVEVDLPPHVARDHPERFHEVVAAASGVTVLAYRDRASAILDWSRVARDLAGGAGRPYRIAVDTLPSTEGPGTTFHGRSESALRRELDGVTAALAADPRFVGVAVHDLAGWRRLGSAPAAGTPPTDSDGP